jgi:hypothetical protein
MAHENTADLCKDCGPTFTAFLVRMADHNKEQMELNAKVARSTCRKVEGYTFRYASKATVPAASAP